jgi:hypothetical protein
MINYHTPTINYHNPIELDLTIWIWIFLFLKNKSLCFYSSFVFIVNLFFTYIYQYYTYSILFFTLWITSIYFYSCRETIPFFLDQISILLVVTYGMFLFYHKKKTLVSLIVLFTFLLTIYLFYYGYLTNQYCYGDYGEEYHALLHIISCIGHLAILF